MYKNNSSSLLEMLARRLGCEYFSDLKYLRISKRILLTEAVRAVPVQSFPTSEWNDALNYLAGQDPQPTAERARQKLLETLETLP